jgi:N-acetylneuraminic acid mutarotase
VVSLCPLFVCCNFLGTVHRHNVIGGAIGASIPPGGEARSTKTTEIYRGDLDQWFESEAMLEDHSLGGAVCIGGRAYVCGGIKSDIFEAYDPREGLKRWQSVALLPQRRAAPVMIAVGSSALLIGGYHVVNGAAVEGSHFCHRIHVAYTTRIDAHDD